MLLLTSTSDKIQMITGSAGSVVAHGSYTDLNAGTVTPARTNTPSVSTATTTDIVGAPAASTQRNVQYVSIRNIHATIANLITVQHTDGTNVIILYKYNLVAGAQLIYDGSDWVSYDANGNILTTQAYLGAAGSDTQVQYNDGGLMAGDANLTWNKTEKSMGLVGVSAEPATPAAGLLKMYSRAISGRMMLKWFDPSGFDNPIQPSMFARKIATYFPLSSTTAGGAYGISWTPGGTVSHPTPASGIVNQIHRTRFANVVTTTNQTLGIIATASGLPMFWRGNAAGQGGFFFMCRYTIELWAANTCRIFVGLSDSTTAQVTLDAASFTGNLCAFVHDTADGANVLWFVTRDGTTTHKTTIAGATIAAGQGFDFYIYSKPNDTTLYYRVDSVNSGTILVDTGETNNLPTNTVMMGPQVTMSNGTANITATTVAPAIASVYIESDH